MEKRFNGNYGRKLRGKKKIQKVEGRFLIFKTQHKVLKRNKAKKMYSKEKGKKDKIVKIQAKEAT